MVRVRKYLFYVLLIAVGFMMPSCDTPITPAALTYDLGSSTDIKAVTVFYPADIATSGQNYNAVTLSGGSLNTKADMYWLANSLVENDIIVFALSAADNMTVAGYEKAQKACYNLIKAENTNTQSAIYGRVNKIGLVGFSMGGGGVINAAQDMGSQLDVAVALAPYKPETVLTGVKASVLIMVGLDDTTAPAASNAEPAYENLPGTIKKACALIDTFVHTDFNGNSAKQDPAKTMTVAWIKYILDGDQASLTTLENPPSPITYYKKNF